jgi:beta-fructofuranosidase
MYSPPSFSGTELGDIDVQVVDDQIHLHHLCLPNHDAIGHAVSRDGLTFTPAPVALRTGDPGECDDDMIWTMHSVRHPQTGLWHMYYTACALAERGLVQRVALATSPDFRHWTKHPANPVSVAAAPHYNEDLGLLGRIAYRDPFVYVEDGTWHLLVCASANQGDRLRRGCVSHATSADGLAWTLQPPLYAPAQYDDLEVPALLRRDGRYYLFFHEFRTPRSYYRIADRLTGPWQAPAEDELLPGNHCVFRFVEWQGATLLYCWFSCQADWPRRNPGYRALFPPKEVQVQPDGTLRLGSFRGWRATWRGPAETLAPAAWTAHSEGPATWQATPERLTASVVGQLLGAATATATDFVYRQTVCFDEGRALGLLFRASPNLEDGYWLRLDYARQNVELHYLTAMDSSLRRYVRRQPSLKQECRAALPLGRPLQLQLIASHEYVELTIDGRVVLSVATWARPEGRLGVFLENGRGWFGPATVQPIAAPTSGG